MKKTILVILPLLLASAAFGQEPPQRPYFEPPQRPSRPPIRPRRQQTYEEAKALAEQKGLPLLVWVGDGYCPNCVYSLRTEAVHYESDTYPGVPPSGGVVVGVHENGRLLQVATITGWTTGDPVWGHVASVRRALNRWRTQRQTTEGWSMPEQVAAPAPASYRSVEPFVPRANPPAAMVPGPAGFGGPGPGAAGRFQMQSTNWGGNSRGGNSRGGGGGGGRSSC